MTSGPLDPQVLAAITGLELRARTIVDGHLAGLHRSPRKGFSVEFAEHREYAPGDDLRYLDWKVYGKRDRYYLKQFEEETNLCCHLIVDASESMAYRSAGAALSKWDYASCLAASLAWIILKQQDAVGLVTVDDEIRQLLRPSGQATHLKQILASLEQTIPSRPSSLGTLLHQLAERLPRRGVVILISDLFDDLEAMMQGFKHLKFQGHDVAVLQVIDPAEVSFPFAEPTEFEGLEKSGLAAIDPRSIGDAYRAEFAEFLQTVGIRTRDLQIDHQLIETTTPPDRALLRFLTHHRHAHH
ncbi:MAG: DUF58 domain-containing protein [Planctomycetaceae bacterium]